MGTANLIAPLTEEQMLGLQLSRTFASIPSLIGAAYIVQHVARSPNRRKRVLKRIMLGMSLMDLVLSCVTACSSFLVVPNEFNRSIQLASGTWATCEASAFLGHGCTVASALYNASLALYYLLTIRYGWTETKVKKIETLLQLIPLVVGWSAAIAALVTDSYNPMFVGCGIASYPIGCGEGEERPPCQRGQKANISNVLLHSCMWGVFVFLAIAMLLIFHSITSRIRRTRRSRAENSVMWWESGQHFLSNARSPPPPPPPSLGAKIVSLRSQFATQALLYCGAYGLTWFFGTLQRILTQFFDQPIYVPILFLSIILSSLQGFWNAFIYVRPRYLRYRRKRCQECEEEGQACEQQQQQQQGKVFVDQQAVPPAVSSMIVPHQPALVSALSIDAKDEEGDSLSDEIDEEKC